MTRNRSWLAAVVAVSAGTLFAGCDQPTDVGFDHIDLSPAALASSVSCAGSFGGNPSRTLTANIKNSAGNAAAGVLVTLVSPTAGPVCEAETAAAGVATFTGIRQGSQFVVLVREEVNEFAAQMSIAPPDPNFNLTALVPDAPTTAGAHHQPALLRGAACTEQSLTWTNYTAAFGNPCVMGNGLTVTVNLSPTTGVQGTLVGLPAGTDMTEVIVAGVSHWGSGTAAEQQAACDLLVWLPSDRRTECGNPNLSNGAAVLQAVGRPNAAGQFRIGSAGNQVVIETVLGHSGFTFFGTAFAATGGTYNVSVVPGMCRVEYIENDENSTVTLDETNPSGSSPLDILYVFSTIGLTTDTEDGLMVLKPVESTIVVGAAVKHYADNKGEVTFQFKTVSGSTRTIKAPFSITATSCTWGAVTGNGVPFFDGHVTSCIKKNTTAFGQVPEGEVFNLALVLTGVSGEVDRSSATHTWKAGRDNADASRFSYLRGSFPLVGQGDTTCPVPTNNDGRYDTGV